MKLVSFAYLGNIKNKKFKEKKGKIGLGFDKISNQKDKPFLFN